MRRWHKIAGTGAGVLLLGGGVLAATWPTWLEGYAESRMVAALEARFDSVEHGSFELTDRSVTVTDLTASRPGAEVQAERIEVGFTLDWWARRVVVDSVTYDHGRVTGTLEGLRSLRGSDEPPRGGPRRLDLSGARLDVVEVDVDVTDGDRRVAGTVAVEADSPAGPFSVEAADLSVLHGGEALATASRVRATLDRESPFPLDVTVRGVASDAVPEVAIRDVAGIVTLRDRDLDGMAFDLTGETGRGQNWTFDGEVVRSERRAQGHLTASDIRPTQLPIADMPLDAGHGAVSVDLRIHREGDRVSARGTASVRDVHVVHPRLAKDPVVVGADVEVGATADLGTRELVVEGLKVRPRIGDRLSTVEVDASGRLLYAPDPGEREYEITMRMAAQPCQEVLDAMPPGLLPGLGDFQLAGDVSLDFHTVVKMNDPDATVLEGGFDAKGCKIQRVPDAVDMLARPFRHVTRMKSGRVAQVALVPGSPMYASLEDMTPAVPAAVLSTEDGGFWSHKGYRPKAFLDSLRRNVELGTIRRGASTLTMQAVKNVLLTHERTLSRKLQELFLTWVVETRLSKGRILEIYLNVVEFGPGIYGVAHASDHYFGKKAADLNSMEAAFLASLLPRPLERHDMWCRGEVTEKHLKYLRRVNARMLSKGRITQAAHDRGLAEGVRFTRKGWPGEAECLSLSRREEGGEHVQGALTGLLAGRGSAEDP